MKNPQQVTEESQSPTQPASEKLAEAQPDSLNQGWFNSPLARFSISLSRAGAMPTPPKNSLFLKQQSSGFGRMMPDVSLKKLRGGLLLLMGYLLSPLCWWNDLFFNLPIAYGFGYICSLLSPDLLFPCSIVGYWLSNIVGILLMQLGSVEVFTDKPKEKNLKQQLLTGFISSTAFTLVIVALIHFNVLDTPDLFSTQQSIDLFGS